MSEILADLIIEEASQVLTLKKIKDFPVIKPASEDLGIIENGAVACDGGKIVAIGSTDELKKTVSLREGGKKISARGKILMPGFVDPHTHVVYGGSRIEELKMRIAGKTYQEIQEAGGGIHFTVNATRRADREELRADAVKFFDAMLRHGSTTVETKSGYGLDVENEIKTLEIIKEINESHPVDIVPTFLGAHLVPIEYKDDRKGFVKLVNEEMLPPVAERKLAEFCDVFCEKKAFDVDESREILLAGRKMGLTPKIHADELYSSGGSELAGEIKAISADHLNYISSDGIKALAENGVVATLLPGTSFFLNLDRYPPAREMIEKGVAVALATDYNAGSCWTFSMQMIISLACIKMKMTPEEAIIGATINSACALNKQDRRGSLEVGKEGDIIICDVHDYSHLPFYFGTNQVLTVIKNGKIVFST